MQVKINDTSHKKSNLCANCAYHDDFSWVCFNPEAEDRADFMNPEDGCNCWTSKEEEQHEKNV